MSSLPPAGIAPGTSDRQGGIPASGNLPSGGSIGRFAVQRVLGQGAQGSVYLAHDPHLDRQVAIKAIAAGASEESIRRLHQEARTVSRFSHPNIVTLYDAVEHEGSHYLVLEYVEGMTLADLLKREGRLDSARAVGIAMQVASGLAYAHAKHIIHRDVKPANIMIAAGDTARLMDFGIAVAAGEVEESGRLAGTPRYMAPERLRDSAANQTADVFSLGMVLYEMLAGRPAVNGASPYETMHRMANEAFSPPSAFAPEVDERLNHIVLTALLKDDSDRYATADAMREELEAWLAPNAAPENEAAPAGAPRAAVEFLLRRMRHKSDFPALSQTIGAINRIVADSDESVQALSAALLRDFALTNKLLRLVNSTAFGQFGGNISTISRAVMILGFNAVRSLAVTLILFEHLQNRAQASQLKDEVIGSYFTGILARRIAVKSGTAHAEEHFICGVLHHLGRLLATYYFYDESAEIARRVQSGEAEERAARAVLGVSLEELAVAVARSWHLPEKIVHSLEAVGDDEVAKPAHQAGSLKVVANLAASLCRVASATSPAKKTAELEQLDRRYNGALRVGRQMLADVVEDSMRQFQAESAMFVAQSGQNRVLKAIAAWSSGDAAAETATAPAGAASPQNAPADTVDAWVDQTTRMAAVTGAATGREPGAEANATLATLNAGIQDITYSLVGEYNLNDLLRIILETMYRGMGFSQVLLCTRDLHTNSLKARFGYGARIDAFIRGFSVPLVQAPNVFQVALDKNVDLYIADTRAGNITARLPEWYRKSFNAPAFLLLPIAINKRVVGLFYCDCDQPGALAIQPEQLRLLKTLRNQAVLAIRQKG